MMRKLAISVFAISLSAFGCGSDSGTKDSSVDVAAVKDGGKLDTVVATKSDTAPMTDAMAKDVGGDTMVVVSDAGKDGVTVVPDSGKLDVAPKLDVPPARDGGVDAPKDGSVVDAPMPDAPAMDAMGSDAGGDADNNG
jgi:hypothetical protein